jgi:hypothetical protein
MIDRSNIYFIVQNVNLVRELKGFGLRKVDYSFHLYSERTTLSFVRKFLGTLSLFLETFEFWQISIILNLHNSLLIVRRNSYPICF